MAKITAEPTFDPSSMNIDEKNMKQYIYHLGVEIVGLEKYPEFTNRSIVGLSIEKDFVNSLSPIYLLSLSTSLYQYNQIKENYKDFEFKLTLKKGEFNMRNNIEEQNGEDTFGNSNYPYELVWENSFQPFVDNLDPLSDTTRLQAASDVDTVKDERGMEALSTDFHLLPRDNLSIIKTMNNFILESASVKDAIAYICQNSGVKRLMINTPENETTYDQIIIPPYRYGDALEYLQTIYGIYNTGIRKFIEDDNTAYILNHNIDEIPLLKNEFDTVYIHILNSLESSGYRTCFLKNNEKKIYQILINSSMVNISKQSQIGKELVGNKIAFYNTKDIQKGSGYNGSGKFTFGSGYNITAPNVDADYQGDDKITYFNNYADNPYYENSLQHELEETNLTIEINFSDIDFTPFTMNKKFYLNFVDEYTKKFSGYFFMEHMGMFFQKKNETDLRCFFKCRFKPWNKFVPSTSREASSGSA